MKSMKNVLKLFEREIGINHTYRVEITLGNVSPNQFDALLNLVNLLEESEEVRVRKFKHQND